MAGLEWVAALNTEYKENDDVDTKMIAEKVNHLLIEFKKRYLTECTIFNKYKMVDWMQVRLSTLGYKTSSGQSYKRLLTPANVCDVINDIIGENSAMIHH